MAKIGRLGAGRVGAVKRRSQVRSSATGFRAERDTRTGKVLQVKKSGGAFKGVRREG